MVSIVTGQRCYRVALILDNILDGSLVAGHSQSAITVRLYESKKSSKRQKEKGEKGSFLSQSKPHVLCQCYVSYLGWFTSRFVHTRYLELETNWLENEPSPPYHAEKVVLSITSL